jgi:hypothetical protein
MLNREPRITIVVPTPELAISLSSALSEIPGEKGIGARPDLPYDVTLHDFPRTTVELERLLMLVRAWLAEVDVDSVTVESRWQIKRAKRPGETESRVLTWKLEDGPEDAPEGGSPEDVGPPGSTPTGLRSSSTVSRSLAVSGSREVRLDDWPRNTATS